MQKIKQKFEGARLVFKNPEGMQASAAAPTAAPASQSTSPEQANPLEAARGELGSLAAGINTTVRSKMDETLGEKINWDELQYNIQKLTDLWRRLIAEWSGSFDQLAAVGGAYFGYKPADVRRSIAETIPADVPAGLEKPPQSAETDTENAPKEKESPQEKVARENASRAEHALLRLAEHPDWDSAIDRGSARWGVPKRTYVAFLQMESNFNSNSQTSESSAGGLSQALASGCVHYAHERYAQFLSETGQNNNFPAVTEVQSQAQAVQLLRNPIVAIDFMGWHLCRTIDLANSCAGQEGLPEYKLTPASDPKLLYMAYNNGGKGYVVLRRYLENKTPENYAKLIYFHRETHVFDGRKMEKWQSRSIYAVRAAEVAASYEALTTPLAATHFDSPPLRGEFSVSAEGRFGPRYSHYHGASMTKSADAAWRLHNGIDIPAREGTPVLAVKNGIVEVAERNAKKGGPSGIHVKIKHPNGDTSSYVHLSAISANVKVGDSVSAGQEIGKVGTTGRSEGPHLHFTYRDARGLYRNPAVAALGASARQTLTQTS